MILTEVFDVEALRWFEGPPHPSLPQHLQVILLPLDQQHMLVYPAQEEGLGYGIGHHLIPEIFHVQWFEVGEDLVAGVMVRRLLALRHYGRVLRHDARQHDGQRVRRDLQERLHWSPRRCFVRLDAFHARGSVNKAMDGLIDWLSARPQPDKERVCALVHLTCLYKVMRLL